ncbi:ATP-binding protein [Marinactinospora endophytica]
MTTAALPPFRTAVRHGGVGQVPLPHPDERHALRRIDWAATSSAAFYRSLEAALDPAPVSGRPDPLHNPYTPGAGRRPPELAGREIPLRRFDLLLDRVAHGRPDRSVLLTGPRGVGKTVLLDTFRSMASGRMWGTGGFETRPGHSLRRPIATAVHTALRELAPRHRAPERADHALGVLKSFVLASPAPAAGAGRGAVPRRRPVVDAVAVRGQADSGDLETDLADLFTAAASVATDLGVGICLLADELHDASHDDLSALCAACHRMARSGAPLVVVAAGLPDLPRALSTAKGYADRLFQHLGLGPLDRAATEHALVAPARARGVAFTPEALDELYRATGGHPFLVQSCGRAAWDLAEGATIRRADARAAVAKVKDEIGLHGDAPAPSRPASVAGAGRRPGARHGPADSPPGAHTAS